MKLKNKQKAAAGGERYAPDKPVDCRYCYFWNKAKGVCRRKSCYYLLPPKMEDGCGNCPYGRAAPCIGYCLQKIIEEMRQKRGVKV